MAPVLDCLLSLRAAQCQQIYIAGDNFPIGETVSRNGNKIKNSSSATVNDRQHFASESNFQRPLRNPNKLLPGIYQNLTLFFSSFNSFFFS